MHLNSSTRASSNHCQNRWQSLYRRRSVSFACARQEWVSLWLCTNRPVPAACIGSPHEVASSGEAQCQHQGCKRAQAGVMDRQWWGRISETGAARKRYLLKSGNYGGRKKRRSSEGGVMCGREKSKFSFKASKKHSSLSRIFCSPKLAAVPATIAPPMQ